MKIILETSNPKEFVEYTGADITALLAQAKNSTLPPESTADGVMVVSYIHNNRIYHLHMSSAFNYGISDAEKLEDILFTGEESEDNFQLQKITSHDMPIREKGLPAIAGKKVGYE